MKYMAEREAENFLEKEGFMIVPRVFCSKEAGLAKALSYVGIPFVMKASGEKLIGKDEDVRVGFKSYSEAVDGLKELKKIKGAKGVLVQPKLKGKEFLIGVKKDGEFGRVISFGSNEGNLVHRICPIERGDSREMIKKNAISQVLLREEGLSVENLLLKVSKLVGKYSKISELKVDALVFDKKFALVVDAGIVWD